MSEATSIGMAKPSPSDPVALAATAVVSPTTAPVPSHRAPPEDPRAIGASVWIMSCRTIALGDDPAAEAAHHADGDRRPAGEAERRPDGDGRLADAQVLGRAEDGRRPGRRRRGGSSSTATTATSVDSSMPDDVPGERRCRRPGRS